LVPLSGSESGWVLLPATGLSATAAGPQLLSLCRPAQPAAGISPAQPAAGISPGVQGLVDMLNIRVDPIQYENRFRPWI